MKKLLTAFSVGLASLLCAFTLVGCSGSGKSDLEWVKEKGTLTIGVTAYQPMDYLDEDGQTWIGFDAEMAEKFSSSLGVRAAFQVIKWDNKVVELESKYIDCIWNGMTVLETLKEKVDFSVSYAENKQVAVIRKTDAAKYTTVDSIKTARLTAESGSAGDGVIQEDLGIAITASNYTVSDSQVNALTEVKTGNSDVAIIDYTMAYSIVGKGSYSDLQMIDTDSVVFREEEFGVAFRKGSDLTAKLNEFFKTAYADGTMAALAEKYVGVVLCDRTLSAL